MRQGAIDLTQTEKDIVAVRMLGRFSLGALSKGTPFGESGTNVVDVSGRARRIWILIAYLIIHRDREVPIDELIGVLWKENQQRQDPVKTLQHNVSRARDMLMRLGLVDARKLIVSGPGCYRWNPKVETILDLELFQALLNRADETADVDQRISLLHRAFALYGGDFLPGMESENWVVPISASAQSLYVNHAVGLVRLLADTGQSGQVIVMCEQALRIAPTSEEICVEYMRALTDAGCQEKALEVYESTRRLLMSRLGVEPSAALEQAYGQVRNSMSGQALSLEQVREILAWKSNEAKNRSCSLGVFRSMVHREALNRGRAVKSTDIVVISVDSGDMASAMHSMEVALDGSLRKSDAYTQLTPQQFAVLLPELGDENVERVVDRILALFADYAPQDAEAHMEWLPVEAFLA